MNRPVLLVFWLLFVCGGCSPAHLHRPNLELGAEVLVDLGPSGFRGHELLLDGRLIERAASRLQWVSSDEVIYRGCNKYVEHARRGDLGCDFADVKWFVLDVRSQIRSELTLPEFNAFFSVPTANGTTLAYVGFPDDGVQACMVYDWSRKRLLAHVLTDVIFDGGDVVGTEAPPVFSEDGRSVTCVVEGFARGARQYRRMELVIRRVW